MPGTPPLTTKDPVSLKEPLHVPCYHCGEPCEGSNIALEDKIFCCEGCKMVYEILNENDLCRYYQLDDQAGISLKGRRQEHYAYLDDKEIREQLIDYSNGEHTRVRFHLPQIHCASCIWLLENLYRLNDGITQSKVHFTKKEIQLSYLESQTSVRKIVELLASIGYAPAINLGDADRPKEKAVSRRLYFQLGVAGFAFGNIMLLSFPEYLGLSSEEDQFFQHIFGYGNILLAIPVVFYSGWDYLRSAALSLRHGHFNMDVPISLGIITLFVRSVFDILTTGGAGYLDSLAGLVFFLLIGKWFQQKTFYHLAFDRDYRSYFPIAALLKDGAGERSVPVQKLDPGQTIIVKNGELVPADGLLVKGGAQIDYSFVTGEAEPVHIPIGEKLYAGGRQVGERIEVTLTKKVSQSYLTQLWNDEAFQKDEDSTTQRLADKVGRYFTFIILLVSFATLAYWLPRDLSIAINAFTAVLIVACPCAVALAVPFTFGNSIRILAHNQFFLKNIHVLEGLRNIQSIVFDKTGTLTGVRHTEGQYVGEALHALEKQMVQSLVRQSAHPASQQLDQWLGNTGGPLEISQFEEIAGQGVQGVADGRQIQVGSRTFTGAPPTAGEGVFIRIDGDIKGRFEMGSRYRLGLEEVVQSLKTRYRLFLLSGDNDRERAHLEPIFGGKDALLFQQSPGEKLQFVKKLQADGKKVCMIGDGLNDAGALRQSDTGIVLTENTNNFTPASDAILHAGQFHRLPLLLDFARKNIHLVYAAYSFAVAYNIIGLSFAVQGTLSPVVAAILMPASSITIVLFGVLSSNLLARKMQLHIWGDKNQSIV
ncbi:MAG: heavy metal translocating P-type ATPase metal-binding domain-containing protein [Saprospirales bacterium]|nr:heavy metal translocating P-type ATPase metal-binding domain-containing protein [Saprospirales bacterium]